MKWTFLLLLSCVIGAPVWGQEICDNGVDDDGDGLVDIYDPDCECQGIVSITNQTDLIPNPDFEEYSNCPSGFSQMNFATGWSQGTTATTDYMNTCGFILNAILAAPGLVPFPSGEGIAGAIFSDGWKEYLAACLNGALVPGNQYTLSFQLASLPVTNFGDVCNGGIPFYDPVNVTLWGNTSCNIPVGTTNCPSTGDPNWVPLGTVLYNPVAAWGQVEITFVAPSSISGIMIGPPCNLPNGYSGSPCYAYFIFDDLMLMGGEEIYDLTISEIGLPCDIDFTLYAEVDHQGPGTWQWYFNGAAIPGGNDPEFMVSDNNYQSGVYAAVYTAANGCVMDSISVTIPPKDTVTEQVYYCPGGQVDCAGETFFNPGEYEVHLVGPSGCDSVVQCIVTEYDLPPVTVLDIDTCGPVEIEVCGEIFYETGDYLINCFDWRGCDSIIMLNLRVMNPMAVIQPPALLECGPGSDVVLDGASSTYNPLPGGETFYSWTGPANGLDGNTDEPFAFATKAGKYCLTITHETNGVTCTDSVCVIVESSVAIPNPPIVNAVPDVCLGDTVIITPSSGGGAPATGFNWSYDLSLNAVVINDLYVQYVPSGAGTAEFCATAYNECGEALPTCVQVTTHLQDTTHVNGQTCDPAMAGITVQVLSTQFGCDSVVITDRVLVPAIMTQLAATTCDPQQAGVDTVTYQTPMGCDSLVVTTTTLDPSNQTNLSFNTCDPAQAGVDSVWMQNQYGCDSLVVTTTVLRPSHFIPITKYTCDPSQVGSDTLFLQTAYGCDSVRVTTTIYSGQYQETNPAFICGSGTPFLDTLVITGGPCDSLFITAYQYIPLDTVWLSAETCDATQAGTTVTILPSSLGCDSTIILQTTLLPSDTMVIAGFTCLKSEETHQTLNLQNQWGCDSLVMIDIQYMGVDTQFVQKVSCDAAQAGTVVDILPGTFCDTVRVTMTDFTPSSQSRDTILLCSATGPASDTLILQNAGGCDSLAIRVYTYVNLDPDIAVTGERCAGDQDGTIEVLSVTGGGQPYAFRLNNGPWQGGEVFEDLPPGAYSVEVRDANGCSQILSGLVVTQGVDVAVDAGYDIIAFRGDTVNLSATSGQAITSWLWTAGDPLGCATCPQTVIGPLTGSQTVFLTGITDEGCAALDELTIDVKVKVEVYVPNSFTPNGDGINDVFSVYGNDQVVVVRNLAVFDRWGNALYKDINLPINDPSKGWDGYFRDKLMDPGVYVYVIEVELLDGSIRLLKGDVTLVR